MAKKRVLNDAITLTDLDKRCKSALLSSSWLGSGESDSPLANHVGMQACQSNWRVIDDDNVIVVEGDKSRACRLTKALLESPSPSDAVGNDLDNLLAGLLITRALPSKTGLALIWGVWQQFSPAQKQVVADRYGMHTVAFLDATLEYAMHVVIPPDPPDDGDDDVSGAITFSTATNATRRRAASLEEL